MIVATTRNAASLSAPTCSSRSGFCTAAAAVEMSHIRTVTPSATGISRSNALDSSLHMLSSFFP